MKYRDNLLSKTIDKSIKKTEEIELLRHVPCLDDL
jgi:hypothetical protein